MSIIAGTLTTIAVVYAVVRLRLEQEAGVGSSFRAVLRRLGPIILTFAHTPSACSLLVGLAVAAVALLLSLSPGAVGGGPLAFVAIWPSALYWWRPSSWLSAGPSGRRP